MKIGDIVTVCSNSWSMEWIDGCWRSGTLPGNPYRNQQQWRIVAQDGALPTEPGSPRDVQNSLLLESVLDGPNRLLATRPQCVRIVFAPIEERLVSLEARVDNLEKRVNKLEG